ncbi:hypothetical protein [Spiroplasma endosymbiont of Apeira syringaria]|uniref:hypothetical protein n=1 Tax=Spiroplasma endosymbiont of Apeira syringaria TaxID=3066307 RepID=UPI0030CF0B02
MQDIAVQFEKHCWIHSVSLFPPQVHVGRSPKHKSKYILFFLYLILIFKNIYIFKYHYKINLSLLLVFSPKWHN